MGRQFIETLLDVVDGEIKRNTYGYGVGNKLILGGTNAVNGGSGIPWGGLVGTLIQTRIAYDMTEAAVISGCPSGWLASGSLLDNLNHIRHQQLPATWFGASPTYPPSMKVNIGSGLWYYGDKEYLFYTGGTSPTITIPSGLPRIDLVYMGQNGTLYVNEGTEAADPTITMPTASGVLPITAIYIHPSASAISWSGDYTLYSGYIHRDMRPIITYPPGAASGGGGEAYTFGDWLGEYGDHNVRWQPDNVALLRNGVVTEYADPDDALDAADTAGDVVLVPPGTWTLSSCHTLAAGTAIVGHGGTRYECMFTCTGDAGGEALLTTSGTICNVSVYYDRQTETNATALFIDAGYGHSVYAEAIVGNGTVNGMRVEDSTVVDCHGKASGTVLFSFGMTISNSDLYYCSGEASGFAPSSIAGFFINSGVIWDCRGTATGSTGTRYGIWTGSSTEIIYGRYSGATYDICVLSGSPDLYGVIYDTISGNVTPLAGDRAGKARSETITGDWTFDKPLILSEQGADPSGAADEGKLYTKDDGAGNTELYYVDESGNVDKLTPPSGGGSATTFLGLTDTPSDYISYSGYYVSVKGTEDGLEFTLCSGGGGVTTFTGLSDTPADYFGSGKYVVVVAEGEDELEFLEKAPDADQLDGYDSIEFPRKAENATVSGVWTFNEELILSEQASDPSSAVNTGKLYTKDDGAGNTELYYIDESGNVDKLTPATEMSAPVFTADDLLLLNPFSHIVKVGSNYYWLSTRHGQCKITGAIHWRSGRWPATQALVVEEGTTNYCTNPSFETDTTGWGAGGAGVLAQSDLYSVYGDYCLKDTPTAGSYAGANYNFTLVNGTDYAGQAWVKGEKGNEYYIQFYDVDGSTGIGDAATFTATGQWQHVECYGTAVNNNNGRLQIRKFNSANTDPFYIDGVQIEHKEYCTTYCDGDQGIGYAWTGTVHASTSTRTVTEINLDDLTGMISENNTFSIRLLVKAMYDADDTDAWPTPNTLIMDAYHDASNQVALYYLSGSKNFATYVNGGWRILGSTPDFAAGDFVDILLTFDFTANDHHMMINGVWQDDDTSVMSAPTISQWNLGTSCAVAGHGGWAFSEVAVFDRVLTVTEIANLYTPYEPSVDPLNELRLSMPSVYYHDESNDIIYIWTKTGIIAIQTPSTITHGAKVYRNTSHSIPDNSQTAMSFSTEVYDVGGLWAAGNPTRFTPLYAGYYSFGAAVGWAANANGVRAIMLLKNGTIGLGGLSHNTVDWDDFMSTHTIVYLNGSTDYVEATVFQDSGGALNAGPASATDFGPYSMWIHKLP